MKDEYYNSPHRQITEDFTADVVKVIDGDTISVKWSGRDFIFPVRFINIAAPELKQVGGKESQSWLEKKILQKQVEIIIDPKNRVEKFGRLLGRVNSGGLDIGEQSVMENKSVPWEQRNEGKIISGMPNLKEMFKW